MENSFIHKLSEEVLQKEDQSTKTNLDTIENPERKIVRQESTILVKFYDDETSRKFDPNFLKYIFQEVVCENEEDQQVMASHCCEDNARFFHEIGNAAQELKCYKMLLKTNPNHLPYLSKLAQLSFQTDHMQESIRYYKMINMLYPNNSQAYYNLAVILKGMQRWKEAKTALEKYIDLNPNDAKGYKAIVEIFTELRQVGLAVQTLQKCLQLCPQDSKVLNTLGNIHFSSNPQLAIDYYLKGILADPKYPYNFNGLGVIYNSMKQYKWAIAEFQRAINLNPGEADFHYNKALAYKELKCIEDAQKQFKAALQIDPSYYLSYQGLANIFHQAKQFSKAIRHYQLALQACPNFENAAYNLALAYQSNGDVLKAAKCMQDYLKIHPTDFSAYHKLAIIKAKLGCQAKNQKDKLSSLHMPAFLRNNNDPYKQVR